MKQKNKWTTQFKHLVIGICALFVVFAFGSTALAGFIYDATTYEEEETSSNLASQDGYVDIDFRYAFYSDLNTTDLTDANATKSDVYANDGTTLIGKADESRIQISDPTVTDDDQSDEAKAAYYALNEFLVGHTVLSAELTGDETNGITYTAVDTTTSGDAVKGYTGIMYTIIVYTTIHKDEDFTNLGENTYVGEYVMYSQEYECSYETKQSSSSVRKSLSVPSGYTLTDTYVSGLFSNDVDGYSFYGLVDATLSDGAYIPSTDLSLTYSYGDAINEDKHFYAIYTKSSANADSTITTAVNAATSSSPANIFIGAGGAGCNVANDPTYVESIKNVSLGTSDTVATVAEDATVNFCLNSSATQAFSSYNTEPYDATSNPTGYYLKVEPQEERRAYTVSLQNDLYVNGTLVIGGTYGSGITQATQGNINSYYVVLDLNGHNIHVSHSGSIYCYGMIIDSSNVPGTTYLVGGKITTLLVMLDYKDFLNTFACAESYVCPFQLYFLPYLRCRVEFTYDTTYGWGQINSFCRVHASSIAFLGMEIIGAATDLYVNLVGPASSTDTRFIFELENPETDEEIAAASFVYEYKSLDGLLSDTSVSATDMQDIEDYCLYVRNCLTFNNVKFTMGTLLISFYLLGTDIPIGAANDFNFPISPFFDINMNGATFTLDSMIQFLAGSTLAADSGSKIIFSTAEYSNYPYSYTGKLRFGSLSALDKGINYYDKELGVFVEDNALNGTALEGKAVKNTTTDENGNVDDYYDITASLSTFAEDLIWGNEALWKYLGGASVNIMGKLLFDCPESSEISTWSASETAYKIAGEINFIEDNVGIIYSGSEIMYTDITSGTYDEAIVTGLGYSYTEPYISAVSPVLSYLKSLDPFSALAILAFFLSRPIYIQTYGYDFIPNQYTGDFPLLYTSVTGLKLTDFYSLSTYMLGLVQMKYGACNARGYARPLVSYGKAYVVNSIGDSTYYGVPTDIYEGTFDFDEGIFTSTKHNTIDVDTALGGDFDNGLTTSTESNDYYFDTYDSAINSASESDTDYYDTASTYSSYAAMLGTTIESVDSKYLEQAPTVSVTGNSSYIYNVPNYELNLTPIVSQGTDDIGPYITSDASGVTGAKYRYFAGIWVMDSQCYSSYQMQMVNYLGYVMAFSAGYTSLSDLMTYGAGYQEQVKALINAVQTNLYTNLNTVISGNGTYTVSYVGKLFSWAGCSTAVLYYDSTCQCYKYEPTYTSAVLNLEVNFDNLLTM